MILLFLKFFAQFVKCIRFTEKEIKSLRKRIYNRQRKKRSQSWSLGRARGVEVVNEGFQQGETVYKRF